MGIDSQIGFGIIDIEAILLNKLVNYHIKCHISHGMKTAGWIKAILSYREEFKGKLLIKPKRVTLKRRVGLGTMNCAVKVVVGEDECTTKASQDLKDNPPHWEETMHLNLIHSLNKGTLSIVNVNGSSE